MSENFFAKRREELGLTQRRIAEPLGMTSAAVGAWERGENPPRLTLAARLAEIYQVSEQRIVKEIATLASEIAAKQQAA